LEEFLRLVFGSGWGYLFFAFGNLVTIWVGLTLGNKLSKDFHLPYHILAIFRKNDLGWIFGFSALAEDEEIARMLDRRLYLIYGDLKRLQVVSHKRDSIGTPDQFEHKASVNLIGFDKLLQKRLSGVGDRIVQDEIRELISLWRPYLHDQSNSRILEVIVTSLLCVLGYDIPYSWKRNSFEFIRMFFLDSLVYFGQVDMDNIYTMLEAQKYLITFGVKTNRYKSEEDLFFTEFESDERKEYNQEPLIRLLESSAQAFEQFANNTRRHNEI
jgi:hypothetical protein